MPHLRTMLDLGSFLTTYAFNKVKSVARLVDWKVQDGDNKMVYLNFYNVTSSAPTASSQYPLSCYMTEVSQTSKSMWLPVDCIDDLAFVFLRKEVEDLLYVAQGRTDCFVTMTRADKSEYYLTFSSFPPLHSLSKAVWDGMNRVRNLLRKMLCSTRQDQGVYSCRREKTWVDNNTWTYLCRGFDRLDLSNGFKASTKTSSKISHEILPGLVSTSKRQSFIVDTVAFFGPDGERAVSDLFGHSSTVGLRQRRPKVDDPPKTLLVNDVVNYLCRDEENVRPSVKFEYMHCECQFLVQLAFLPYFVNTDSDGIPKEVPPSPQLNNLLTRSDPKQNNEQEEGHNDLLTVGAKFIFDNKLLKVVSISQDEVIVTTREEDYNERMPKNLVEDLIEQYLE